MFPPTRIVCLTEETVERLYLLGEQDRIVGISGYVVRPPQARREKPRVSAFTSAKAGASDPLRHGSAAGIVQVGYHDLGTLPRQCRRTGG